MPVEGSDKLWWLEIRFNADDVDILDGSVHDMKKNAQTLVVARKEY